MDEMGKEERKQRFNMCLKYILLTLGNINISFIYYFSNKVLNQKQSVCYLFTTQRNTDNIFNTQTSNIQNSVQGSIENIDTEYSSYVPGSRSSSWPLSQSIAPKWQGWAACHLPIQVNHRSSAGTSWIGHLSSLYGMTDTQQKEESYIPKINNKICKTSFSYIFSCN